MTVPAEISDLQRILGSVIMLSLEIRRRKGAVLAQPEEILMMLTQLGTAASGLCRLLPDVGRQYFLHAIRADVSDLTEAIASSVSQRAGPPRTEEAQAMLRMLATASAGICRLMPEKEGRQHFLQELNEALDVGPEEQEP